MSLKTWLAKVESDISGLFSKAATEFEEVLCLPQLQLQIHFRRS